VGQTGLTAQRLTGQHQGLLPKPMCLSKPGHGRPTCIVSFQPYKLLEYRR